ncbi:GDSL esterase/lipase [Striga asiatica]|uniref:GDSL esterase/lipase n=1 Tax=Striga asiatica TaxID=4170 RepID=A0A5A7QJY4_STRAF|nr:GDSL esterase/lipase [Striga asiatica]
MHEFAFLSNLYKYNHKNLHFSSFKKINYHKPLYSLDIKEKMASFSFGKSCTMVYYVALMAILVNGANAKCAFEAMFVFGDSNSDTGGFFAAFPSQPPPFGMTYFNKPTGRASDGRIFVDFLAQAIGLPFISPYLQSIGSDFRHGANFATAGSTVLQPQTSLFVNGVSPFYLQVQVNQMRQFKARVEEYSQYQGQTNLPQLDVFGKALYTIYIGQNDITGYAGSGGPGGIKQVQSQLVSQTISAIKELYSMGARSFVVLNIGPVGCYPAFIVQFPHQSSDFDASGCLASYNNAVNEYNYALKSSVEQVRQELKDANFMYVDTYSVILELFQKPSEHGLQHGTTACCGYGGGPYNFNQQVYCGATKEVDGQTVTAGPCSDPQNYTSWDGVHLTEAASKALAYGILGGSNLNKYCDIQPIAREPLDLPKPMLEIDSITCPNSVKLELELRFDSSTREPLVSFAVLVKLIESLMSPISEAKCDIRAIFNFGDSNSDTGGFWSAFPAANPPNGMTYFKKPAGRASDGRLVIDFLAQGLGLPFLSPYLQSIGSDYRHGANFATLASTVRVPQTSLFVTGVSPFSLSIQLNQMKHFKAQVVQFHSNSGINNLPSPDVFGKSLYTFYIGQNDFTGNLPYIGINGVKQYLPEVVARISNTIKEIYALGGRTFFVMNLAPIGCYPAFLVELNHADSDIDKFGCMISYNNAVVEYNTLLKEALRKTRGEIVGANVIYVDTHSVLLDLFQHPTSHGLKYGTKACCGMGGGAYNFSPKVFCGNTKPVNGQNMTAGACTDPYNYVSWDGIHATEAANRVVARAILNGTLFDPPFELHRLCDVQPIG